MSYHKQKWIQAGSESLFRATGGLAYIRQVTILLPNTWSELPSEFLVRDISVEVKSSKSICLVPDLSSKLPNHYFPHIDVYFM